MWKWLACVTLLVAAPVQEGVKVLGSFEAGWRAAWDEQQMGGNRALFRVVSEGGDEVLRLDSNAAAGALLRPFATPPEVSSISWRWRVEGNLPVDIDETERDGDDYAARLFVIFGDPEMSRTTRALCYVWATRKAVGSSYRSPVVDGVHTIVLQTSSGAASRWETEERDFVEDYRRAFGRAPAGVGALAIMADTDDTGTRATAWFDDLVLR